MRPFLLVCTVLTFISCISKSSDQTSRSRDEIVTESPPSTFSDNTTELNVVEESTGQVGTDARYKEYNLEKQFNVYLDLRREQVAAMQTSDSSSDAMLSLDSISQFERTDEKLFGELVAGSGRETVQLLLGKMGYKGKLKYPDSIDWYSYLSPASLETRTFFGWAFRESEFDLARFILNERSDGVIYKPEELFLVALLSNDLNTLNEYKKSEERYIEEISRLLREENINLYPNRFFFSESHSQLPAEREFSKWTYYMGQSPIGIYVSEIGDPKVVAWLLDNGYSHRTYSGGNDPGDQPTYMIQTAIGSRNYPLSNMLIDRGLAVDLWQENSTENPALDMAMRMGELGLVRRIVRSGENLIRIVKYWDNGGGGMTHYTALAKAIERHYGLEVVRLLLDLGAPVNLGVTGLDGRIPIGRKTPVDLALTNNSSADVVNLLKERGGVPFDEMISSAASYSEQLDLWPIRRVKSRVGLPRNISYLSQDTEFELLLANQPGSQKGLLRHKDKIYEISVFAPEDWEYLTNFELDRGSSYKRN